jgi:hypothetical protein
VAPATDNGMFTFTSEQTIKDLLLVAETLRKSGHRPTLRFVQSYSEEIESIAVDVGTEPGQISTLDPEHLATCDDAYCNSCAPSAEMAVTEG